MLKNSSNSKNMRSSTRKQEPMYARNYVECWKKGNKSAINQIERKECAHGRAGKTSKEKKDVKEREARKKKKYDDLNSGQLRSLHLIFLQFTSSLRSHAAFWAVIPFLLHSALFFFRRLNVARLLHHGAYTVCMDMCVCERARKKGAKPEIHGTTAYNHRTARKKLHTLPIGTKRKNKAITRLHTRSIPSSFINLTSTFAAHLPPIRDQASLFGLRFCENALQTHAHGMQ